MRKFLIGLLGYSLLTSAAMAQVNFVPQVGVQTANIRGNTYREAILKMTLETTSPTDVLCIQGSSSKKIHLNEVNLWVAGTAAINYVNLVHRVALNTVGTKATTTFIPGIAPLNPLNPTATATVVGWNSTGGNPSAINDTSPTYLAAGIVTLGGAAIDAGDNLDWKFGTGQEAYNQRADIASGGTAQALCLDWSLNSSTTAVVSGYIEWTEE
jgi:hypothetical protein